MWYLFIGFSIIWIVFAFFRNGNLKFWKIVARNDKLFLLYFMSSDVWYLSTNGEQPPANREWAVYRFVVNGIALKVYGDKELIGGKAKYILDQERIQKIIGKGISEFEIEVNKLTEQLKNRKLDKRMKYRGEIVTILNTNIGINAYVGIEDEIGDFRTARVDELEKIQESEEF